MLELNQSEYGQVLRINFAQDITTATELQLIIQPKYGNTLIKDNTSNNVTIGAANTAVADDIYLANEFIQYTIAQLDLIETGEYRMRGEAQLSPTVRVVTDFEYFTVLE